MLGCLLSAEIMTSLSSREARRANERVSKVKGDERRVESGVCANSAEEIITLLRSLSLSRPFVLLLLFSLKI